MDEHLQIISGMPIHRGVSAEVVTEVINYKPKPGTIFVVSYPKCGTTWLQNIVFLILRKGKPFDDPLDMFFGCPYLELLGLEALDTIPKPVAVKIHLPYRLAPISKDAKYIYICRNPMDCAVSYYYHLNNRLNIAFDQYFESFLSGNISYGDYFDHVLEWYEHRDDPNIHFLSYEHLKKDIREEILKIAKFIGEEYWELLVKEPKVLDGILQYSSFDYMKKDINDMMVKFWNGEVVTGDRIIPSTLKMRIEKNKKESSSAPKENFMRKGKVGDWKNHFSPDQKRRYEDKIAEKTANCDIKRFWN